MIPLKKKRCFKKIKNVPNRNALSRFDIKKGNESKIERSNAFVGSILPIKEFFIHPKMHLNEHAMP